MYLFRFSNIIDLILWLVVFLLPWLGGWLLAAHVLDLRPRERVLAGLGLAVLLLIVLSALWGYLLPVPVAFWAAGGTTLAAGLLLALRRRERPFIDRSDLHAWPLLIALLGLTILFALINRGLAIFDDYHNLPLVSTLAASPGSGTGLPPTYFLNTAERLAYHYGLHLFSAGLVRVGGFTPWSAYDLGKAFSLALAAVLAWLWFRRVTRSRWAGLLGTGIAILGGGSRWLLLLIPAGWMERLSSGIALLGSAAQSGPDLVVNLRGPWSIDGGGPIPFPFAFANGIFPPQVMSLGGSAALPVVTLFLLLLLTRRRWSYPAGALTGLVLGSLALTAEHIFLLVWGGLFLVLVLGVLQKWGRKTALSQGSQASWGSPVNWGLILAVSAATAAAAGGVITEIIRRQLVLIGGGVPSTSSDFTGFGLRWPPSLISGHLGNLSLGNPGHLLIGLAEIGVALGLGPWVSWWCWKRYKQGDWLVAALGAAALFGFLIPIFVRYLGFERDIVRLASAALFIWLILGFPLAWFAARRGTVWLRIGLGAGYLIAILGGLVLLGVQLLAIPSPQLSNFIKEPDASLSQTLWNRLEPGAEILDRIPHRAVTLFGLGGGHAQSDPYTPFPDWEALIGDPDPAAIAGAGYTYVYLDRRWWEAMSVDQQRRFEEPCVQIVAEESGLDGDFRRLLDVRTCGAE